MRVRCWMIQRYRIHGDVVASVPLMCLDPGAAKLLHIIVKLLTSDWIGILIFLDFILAFHYTLLKASRNNFRLFDLTSVVQALLQYFEITTKKQSRRVLNESHLIVSQTTTGLTMPLFRIFKLGEYMLVSFD